MRVGALRLQPVGSRVSAGRSSSSAAAIGLAREWLCGPARHPTGRGSTEVRPCQSRPALLVPPARPNGRCLHAGDDRRRPHKASHTAAALDEHGHPLGQQHIPATLNGYQTFVGGLHAGRSATGRWRAPTGWVGRWRSGWSATGGGSWRCRPSWPPRVRVLSVGLGRKSDPDDAVSVAVAARHAPSLRQVRVEDQTVVLHLLIKRRQDLVAARTQTNNRLHRLLMDLVPGPISPPTAPPHCWPQSGPPVRRRSLAGSWLPSSWPTSASWSSASPPWRRASRPRSRSPRRACSSCSGWGRCWPPGSWARLATSAGFPASTLRRGYRHRPPGGLQRPGHPPPAVPGR
jgi:hypothetical protein